MKRILNIGIAVALTGVALSSCQKKFDPKSYAPPLSIAGYTSTKQVAASNLVSYFSFNGSAIDSVSNTAGTVTGSTFTTGFEGQGLQGAVNSYVLAAPSEQVASMTSFTITEWINTSPPTTGIIGIFTLAKTNAFWGNIEIFIENGSTNENGKLRIHIALPTDDKTFAVDNIVGLFNKWNNIAVTYDETSSIVTLYINGSKVSAGTVPGLAGPLQFNNVGNLVFGCVQFQTDPSQTSSTGKQDWANYLVGQMDEVRIYNKALSNADIGAIVGLEGRGK